MRSPSKNGPSKKGPKKVVIFQNLPRVLRTLRGRRTLTEVARGTGMAKEHLAVMEAREGRSYGKRTLPARPGRMPRLDTLDVLLQFYGVSLEVLSAMLQETVKEEVDPLGTQRKDEPRATEVKARPDDRPATTYWRRQGLSTRAANALSGAGIEDLNQLREARDRLGKIPNLGKVSRAEVESLLADEGIGAL